VSQLLPLAPSGVVIEWRPNEQKITQTPSPHHFWRVHRTSSEIGNPVRG